MNRLAGEFVESLTKEFWAKQAPVDNGPYTGAGQQTSRADHDDAVIKPACLPNRSFFDQPQNQEN